MGVNISLAFRKFPVQKFKCITMSTKCSLGCSFWQTFWECKQQLKALQVNKRWLKLTQGDFVCCSPMPSTQTVTALWSKLLVPSRTLQLQIRGAAERQNNHRNQRIEAFKPHTKILSNHSGTVVWQRLLWDIREEDDSRKGRGWSAPSEDLLFEQNLLKSWWSCVIEVTKLAV